MGSPSLTVAEGIFRGLFANKIDMCETDII